ncbi:hypothetical protein ASE61_06995 [Bosea sp. Root670]|uniref:virion core protein, T7 gp14 family n=1 Tax=Bosea sp. Root670 TaxID=1736583 RepID=UPI000712BF0D|nr:hypothetical protein [Bosea sp. Root670]KRE04666.1 hypothetical protein ASE61_06995 [Bosea sp. Root670]
MCVAAAAAVIGTAAGIGGQIIGYQAQNKAAWEHRAYNAQVEAQQLKYRAELIKYQNVTYQQEVDHGHKVREWKETEFDRQATFRANAQDSIQKNLFAQYATLLQRQVEEGMAFTFDSVNTAKDAAALRAKGQVAADAKGIEGSSIEQLIDDVSRQEGDTRTVMQMNRSATQRQLALEAMGLKASADQQLYNLPTNVFQPEAALNPPQPVNPVSPAAPVASPNKGAVIANVVGSVVSGMSNYASWSGQSMANAFKF